MPLWYALLAVLLSVLAVSGATLAYTAHVQREAAAADRAADREADQRWCELLTVLDEAYGSTPPQTELGRRVADAVHQLRVGFNCT
ncbi:hypothetical protein O7626_41130 [Micromonospora sp. WMMD1102]|uniref:hypothetical protein n=1 Tax=Micromonospora sp. WMMD1102 TaxID=3016105 RepID=UPI002415196F|nr:hypothetical protein [Micromonospora sp. WMMD1102]MDG4784366.1 hypothetical protein [Micromonospora sp. WMMD1102]MDG4784440.1 hypothetical protein [Micromonospora sp. WMMD1102]MDG4792209.1 hypothetical protein [Micromonospora sp. WMMD1102]